LERGHAVVVVAEGAGQDLFAESPEARDASGNVRLRDIGPFLSEGITTFFANERVPVTLRYFDPSYQIRSRPANCEDAVMCDQFARQAVHAALAGKTGLVVGFLHGAFIHVPTDLIVSGVKQVEPDGPLWQAVLATTGQPPRFE
jgi:6-phosphofructokinase 1